MALTKADIIAGTHNRLNYSRSRAASLLETTLETTKDALESDEDVLISGFGKFCVKKKNERRGRNPATGNELTLGARRVTTFRCSTVLNNKVSGTGKEAKDVDKAEGSILGNES